MIYGGELYRDDCNKVSFILNSYQDHLDSIKEFPDLKRGLLKVFAQAKAFLFDIFSLIEISLC